MAPSTDTEDHVHHLKSAAAGIVCVAGLIVQSIILAVNITDWLKGRSMTTADHIITSLGMSRFVFHFISLESSLQFVSFATMPKIFHSIFTLIGNTSVLSSIWLSALLSVIFCLKISNFHNVLFLRLRVIISQKTIHLIALAVLWSFVCASFYSIIHDIEYPDNSTLAKIVNDVKNSEILTYVIILCIPLFIYFLSTVLLITPLCLHMKRIKSDENLKCHLDTYIKTTTFMITSFVMCAAFIIFTVTLWYLIWDLNLGIAEAFLIFNTFPLLHSVYLIYGTARLRNHFVKVFQRETQCLFSGRRSESDSRDPVKKIIQ